MGHVAMTTIKTKLELIRFGKIVLFYHFTTFWVLKFKNAQY